MEPSSTDKIYSKSEHVHYRDVSSISFLPSSSEDSAAGRMYSHATTFSKSWTKDSEMDEKVHDELIEVKRRSG